MTSEEEEEGSAFDLLGENWRSALVVNSLHDALEETERQRDELADMLSSNLQAGPPLFSDNNNAAAVECFQDRDELDGAAAAPAVPAYGNDRGNDISNRVGSNGAGAQSTRRDAPRLLRNALLARQPQPQQQPQSALTVTPSCQPKHSHSDERAAGTVRDNERRGRLGDAVRMLPPAPSRRSRVGDPAEVSGSRSRSVGGAKREAEEGVLSAASIGSVGGELRGGELERVRGRVADLSAAIETSQAKLLQELSQVQEEFFSSFGYTPQPGSTGIGGDVGEASSSDPAVSRSHSWGFPPSRDSSPLRRRDLGVGTGEGPGIARTIDRWGDSSGRITRGCGGRGVSGSGSGSGSGATFVAARTEEGDYEAFPLGLREAFPERGRIRSPSMSESSTSHAGWSRDAGRGRLSPTSKAGADELRKRLLAELVEKKTLARELQETKREAEECHTEREGVEKELDHLRKACRSAHDRAEALERSLSEHRQESEAKGAIVREAAEKELKLEADRDRMAQEYDSFRRKSAERVVSLWLREKDSASLRAATCRWREAALRGARLKDFPVRLDWWRARKALARWRLKIRVCKSSHRASIAGVEQEYDSFRRKSAERVVSLWLREKDRASLRAATCRWREAALRGARLKDFPVRLDWWRAPRALARWRLRTRVCKSSHRASIAGVEQAFRRRGILCLKRWRLVVVRKKRLRRLLRARAALTLLRAWSKWKELVRLSDGKVGMLESQLEQSKELHRVSDGKVGMLESQLKQSEELVRVSDGKVGLLETQLEQSKELVRVSDAKVGMLESQLEQSEELVRVSDGKVGLLETQLEQSKELVRVSDGKVGMLETELEQSKELVRVSDGKVGMLETELEQSKVRTEEGYNRIAAVRSKSLQRTSNRRVMHAAFSDWSTHCRERARARVLLSRLLHRRRRSTIAEGLRRISAETARSLVLERMLSMHQVVRNSRVTALWWSRLVDGVERSKRQKQALRMLLVRRPVHDAFERLKQRVDRKRAARAALTRLCRSTEMRMVDALRRWSHQASASSSAAATLSRFARHHHSRAAKEALFRWRCAASRAREELSEDRMAAAEASLARGQGRARRAAAAALLGALLRDRRRSLVWGFGVLEERRLVIENKSKALDKLSHIHRRRGLIILSETFSRWRGQIVSRALAVGAVHHLEGLSCRMELREAMQRWERAVESQGAAQKLAELVERTVSRVFLARSWRRWHAECCRRRDAEVRERGENRRRALCGRLQAGARRALLLRCLMEWKVQTVIRRCQLRSARSLLFARDHRTLRETFGAWRDGRRGRARTSRALFRVARVMERATLRAGFRRLVASARRKDHEEALAIVATTRLERDRALRDRDAMNARLLEAVDEARRVSRERALAEDVAETELLSAGKRRTISDCFSAWKALAQLHQRRIVCAQRLVSQLRRASLRQAFARWIDEARESASFALMERLLARQGRWKTLRTNLRAWYDFTKRSRRAETVLSRAVRVVSTLEKRRTEQAFWAWRAAAALRSRRAVEISSGCARLQGVGGRVARLQLASAFTRWARLSSAAAHADHKAKTAAAAQRRRILRACLAALSRNASAQRRGRRALSSLDRTLRLRRLARGWGAITAASAAAAVASGARARLRTAEARVLAGREVARVRAHRTARRLLGVARGRTALEAFVAWRAFARQARGARLGARALAARTRRRILRDTFARWQARSLAMSRLRARALARLSATTVELVARAFKQWRERTRAERAKEAATVALKRVCDHRRSNRAGKLLALRTWRRNACRGDEEFGSSGEEGIGTEEWDSGALEALAGVAVEAAAAFSSASSVPRVFALVEEFVSMAVPVSRGHLLLLTAKPGGELSGLEFDRTANPLERAPLEVSLPVGDSLVHRCVSTGLPCQTIKGRTSSLDNHFLYLSNRPSNQSFNKSDSFCRGAAADLYGVFPRVGLHKSCRLFPADGFGSGIVPEPPPPPLDGLRRRSRLAFFPAPPDEDDSRSPSPTRTSSRSPRFRSTKPPRIPGLPRRPVVSEGCCASLPSADFNHVGVSAGGASGVGQVAEDEEAVVLSVACVPVGGGGDGGRAMLGVLKAWRWQEQNERDKRRELSRQSSSPYYTAAEMAALVVLAGHASAALRRLEDKSAEREGETKNEREQKAVVKEEVKCLREAIEHLSDSAKGLARQRDEARAELSRAKGTLRRMVPALRDARDRQLGFRHYHDLIVNMSRTVLKEEAPEEADASPTRAQSGRSSRLGRGRSGKRADSHSTGSRGSSRKTSPVRSPSSPAALRAVEGAAGLQRAMSYGDRIDGVLRIRRNSSGQALPSQEGGHRCFGGDGEGRGNADILNALRETAAGGGRGQNEGIPGSRAPERRRA